MKAKIVYIAVVLALVFSMVAVLSPASQVIAATLCVNPGGTGGCYASIQAAIDAANPAGGDTIIIVAGTYNEHDITINKSLTIQGAGTGSTFIDGQDISRVFYINQSTVDISGMTIRNGNISSSVNSDGGGIYINNSTVTLTNCIIRDNEAGDDGGGILNIDGELTMNNCTVSGNEAPTGGGIMNSDGDVSLTDCTFDKNKADRGGGIFNGGGTVEVTGCTISENIANGDEGSGGGIWTRGGDTLEMADCTITTNNASNRGGGICVEMGDTVILTSCTISMNKAEHGGGIYHSSGTLNMTNCTVSGNYVTGTSDFRNGDNGGGNGGGIYIYESDIDLTNCTITDNSANYENVRGTEYVKGNGEGGNGGGIYLSPEENNTELICTIVYDNYADGGGENIYGSPSSTIQCIIGSPNPLLGPLQNNGGLTNTHALLTGSPAINGCNTSCTIDNDQRSISRPQGGACDVGAYEIEQESTVVGGTIESVDKLGILAPWLGLAALILISTAVIVLVNRKRIA